MERERRFAYLILLIWALIMSIIPLGVQLYGKPFMFYRFGLPFGAYFDVIEPGYRATEGYFAPPLHGYWSHVPRGRFLMTPFAYRQLIHLPYHTSKKPLNSFFIGFCTLT